MSFEVVSNQKLPGGKRAAKAGKHAQEENIP